jgi:hypothetical protein
VTPTTMTSVVIDAVDAIELAEICEFLDEWLTADPAAAASYDRHVGRPGQADELRTDLARLAGALMTAKFTR